MYERNSHAAIEQFDKCVCPKIILSYIRYINKSNSSCFHNIDTVIIPQGIRADVQKHFANLQWGCLICEQTLHFLVDAKIISGVVVPLVVMQAGASAKCCTLHNLHTERIYMNASATWRSATTALYSKTHSPIRQQS